MKKIFIGVLALALSYGSFAQSKNASQKNNRKENKKDWSEGKKGQFENLQLSDAQQAQMKTLNDNFRTRMQALKQDSKLSDEARKQQRQQLMNEHRTQMQSLLTPEQRTKWEEQKKGGSADWKTGGHKQMKDKGNAATRGNKGKADHMNKMKDDLNLSADQNARMKTINERFRTNMQNIRQNNSLSQDQKKEQVKELQKKHREEVSAVLTNEQKEKLKKSPRGQKNRGANKYTK